MSQIPRSAPHPVRSRAGAKKKGLPVLAWIGIGCGALLVIAVAIVIAGGFFVARTVSKASKDPPWPRPNYRGGQPRPRAGLLRQDGGHRHHPQQENGRGRHHGPLRHQRGQDRLHRSQGGKNVGGRPCGGRGRTLRIQSEQGDLSFGGGTEAQTPIGSPPIPELPPRDLFDDRRGQIGRRIPVQDPGFPADRDGPLRGGLQAAGFEVNKQTYSAAAPPAGWWTPRAAGSTAPFPWPP